MRSRRAPGWPASPCSGQPLLCLICWPRAPPPSSPSVSNQVRAAKAKELAQLGFKLATAIHPSAVVAHDIIVGAGTVIMAGVVVNCGSRIGTNVIVNTGGHARSRLHSGRCSFTFHRARTWPAGGDRRNTHVGIRASIIQGIKIGADAIVERALPSSAMFPAGLRWWEARQEF